MSVYALADLHGQKQLWENIKKYLKPNDILYFLGDAIDRGPDGYEIMKELLLDHRVIYIKGNHEQMMENALKEIKRYGGEWFGKALELWEHNGCYPTIEAWEADGSMYDWIYVLKELPYYKTYINKEGRTIQLSHAGWTPGDFIPTNDMFLWDRGHFFDKIPEEYIEDGWIMIHGHTPNLILMKELGKDNYEEKNGIVMYADGAKIDIDCGCFFTNQISLLNLDTFKTILFKQEGDA